MWHAAALLLMAILVAGCGGEEEGGTAEFRQSFERPTVAPAPSKPEKTLDKDLSPRERKALQKNQG